MSKAKGPKMGPCYLLSEHGANNDAKITRDTDSWWGNQMLSPVLQCLPVSLLRATPSQTSLSLHNLGWLYSYPSQWEKEPSTMSLSVFSR